jgi:hypothetical protein
MPVRPLRPDGDAVAVIGGLAAERHHAAWAQHAPELAERGVQVRKVVQHGMAEDQIEGAVVEGQIGGVAGRGLDRQPEFLGRVLELSQHAGRDVGRHRLAHHAGAQQVQREVAGAGADLERPPIAPRLVPERLSELALDLRLADLAVVDSPLRVVVVGGEVVVADVRVPDALRALHRPGEPSGA